MAVGTVLLGSGATISAATTTLTAGAYVPGTFSPVSDMNRIDDNSNRGTSNFPVFGRPTAHSVPAPREVSVTIAGFFSQGDTGQGILIAAEAVDDVIAIQYLRDGTNGWTQSFRVGSIRQSASPEGLQEVSFDLVAVDDRVNVGTG